ncbi:hypothetical protein RA27_20405 [Ruegeria sp. ANG-R]|uniref:hypothetical protein n=1 Tax=Ruegeria sp. ANG-R TaxID=1577903 RepID=UPI00057D1F5A|nr:hypothetical protein [Ruegeria sp. ANG-R]KIC38135.1 hypothetical protein RA27_20405 [Ruegeria sp. ANG-R]
MPEHIQALIDLAQIYFEDGAPITAADRLRSAADEMQKIADQRLALIAEISSEKGTTNADR